MQRNDDDEIKERIDNRRPFRFSYIGYGLIKAFSFCICCKQMLLRKWPYYRKQWFSYEKFKKARYEMLRERDVEYVIYNLRILKFMQKTLLKKRQRDIVQYFMRYLIENDEICEREVARRAKTAEQLIEDLDPIGDIYDRRILFEMTSRRIEAEDYQHDTSFEEDTSQHEEH